MANGLLFFAIGNRGYETFSFLQNSLPRSEVYYTDAYNVYQVLDNHVVGKEYTYTVESYNSYCRAHLARLARHTRAVNGSGRMVDYNLSLLNVIYPTYFQEIGLP
ncbi:hypothetical protein J5U21_01795 [Saccharolobus shibatae]|uniref:Uncharacterized protein n=1 Tax=Saccharolobus shibatae TaxID=2286 RepID=A0A8F5GWJ3_9CREN|nr:hypothetical protein J5U21_01795 [Saccharolobus shibatae]